MFKVKENDLFSKNMSGSELYQTTKMSKYNQSTSQLISRHQTKLSSENNSSKLVTDYDKESFDEWMKDLIDRNGVTNYQYVIQKL